MTYVCTSTYSPLHQMFPFYFDLHIRAIRQVRMELLPGWKALSSRTLKKQAEHAQQKRSQTQLFYLPSQGLLTPKHVEALSSQINTKPKYLFSQLIWITGGVTLNPFSLFSQVLQEDCNRDSQCKKCARLVEKVTYYCIKVSRVVQAACQLVFYHLLYI